VLYRSVICRVEPSIYHTPVEHVNVVEPSIYHTPVEHANVVEPSIYYTPGVW
jgi:hypothetical protein